MSEPSNGAPAPITNTEASPAEGYKQLENTVVNELNGNKDGTEHINLEDEDAIDAAAAAGDLSKKEASSLKRKLKLKVDGQEFEEEVDLGDENYLIKELQKSKAFDKRMQEFAGYKKQVDAIMKLLDEDPEALLEKMGRNVDEMAEKRLRRKVEEMEKSPEQLEREKMAKELEDLRNEKKRIEEEKQKAEMDSLRNKHGMEIERDIKSALDQSSTILPKNPLVMHRIGQALFMAMRNGYTNVKVSDVIPIVEKQYKQELSELFSVMPEDTIEALIGKEPLHKWRKSLVAKSRAAKIQTDVPSKPNITDTGKAPTAAEKAEEARRFRDVFKFNV